MWTVQADSDRKIFFRQEKTPILIEKDSIGLHPVDNFRARRTVLFLKGDDVAEVSEAEEGRFPPVPGETDDGSGGGFDVLNDVVFEETLRHADRPDFGIEISFVKIITVGAGQIAGRSGRLGKDLEITRGFGHMWPSLL